MKKGSKLNKTKRGGERVFTEPEQLLAESKSIHKPEDEYQPVFYVQSKERKEKVVEKVVVQESESDSQVDDAQPLQQDPSMMSRSER